MLGSFKHKLAVYFLLLAVVPLTAAFWGFGMLAKRAEERRVDSRLAAELRAVVASYGRQTDRVRILARDLARRRDVQTAVRTGRDEFAALAKSFNAMSDELRTRMLELEIQRTRLRDALARFGELLEATHDVEQLLTVIASAALEAADAEGALLLGEEGTVVEIGTLADDAERFEFSIATADSRFGILILYAAEIREDDLVATRALVAQGAAALENARLHEAVELRAISDGLTGLANRGHCEERLLDEVARSERYDTPLAVLLGDIDGFKAANDTYGHAFGDLVLQGFAGVLGDVLRDVDISGRWGGGGFPLGLPGTTRDGAIEAGQGNPAALAELNFATGARSVRMTASFGVAAFVPRTDAQELVRAADQALYAAKRRGKNRVEAASEVVATSA